MINVLIVDDDALMADVHRLYVDHVRGFCCQGIVHTVAQARRLLARAEDSIDLIMLNKDIAHSSQGGLLSALCEVNARPKVMVVSTSGDFYAFHREVEPYRHRVVGYLLAPFQFTRLEHKLSAYREKAAIYQQRSALAPIAQVVKPADGSVKTRALPKGLTRMTLSTVCRWIKSNEGRAFSTKMMADAIGISSVSCRKYLHYLSETHMLTTQLHYGTSGRPMYLYRLLSNAA